LLSPPAGPPRLESSEPVGQGRLGAGAQFGAHSGLFGPDVTSGHLTARYGFTPRLEAAGSAGFLHVDTWQLVEPPHANAYSGRLSLKWAPFLHSALVGGVGGGASAAGGFIAPDIGILLAYENDALVPVFGVQGGVSVPVAPKTLDLSTPDNRTLDRPEFTTFTTFTLGLVIVVSGRPTLKAPARLGIEIPLGVHYTIVRDDDTHVGMLGVGIGLQATWSDR
jgi:hypothetical protein